MNYIVLLIFIYAYTEKLTRKIYFKLLTAVTLGIKIDKEWERELLVTNVIRNFYKGKILLDN